MRYVAIFFALCVTSTGVFAVSPSEEMKSFEMMKVKHAVQKQK